MRYEIFEKKPKAWAGQKIAVAHNRGDDAETVLFHLDPWKRIVGNAGHPSGTRECHPSASAYRTEEILSYLEEKNSLIVWMQQTVMSITPETASGRESCQD